MKNEGVRRIAKKIQSVFFNPFVLALLPTLVFIWLVPVKSGRYVLETVSSTVWSADTYLFYEDLDGNGFSERIRLTKAENRTSVNVDNRHGDPINQWNLHGTFDFYLNRRLYIAGDYDNDGIMELYVFTISNDSIFLHVMDDYRRGGYLVRNRLVAVTGPGQRGPDPLLVPAGMEDLNGDGRKELIFGISAGFSFYPRQVYAYYVQQDSLVVSPEAYAYYGRLTLADINGSGTREAIIHTYSTANIDEGQTRYHDQSNWLMVLDEHMEFLFEPVEFPGRFQSNLIFGLERDGKSELAVFNLAGHAQKSTVSYYSASGVLRERKELPGFPVSVIGLKARDGTPLFGLFYPGSGLMAYDVHMNLVRSINLPGERNYIDEFEAEIGKNKYKGIMMVNFDEYMIYFMSDDMRHLLSTRIRQTEYRLPYISLVKNGDAKPYLSIQIGTDQYLLSYGPNRLYFFGLGIYPLIYLGMLAFAAMTRRAQRRQIAKQQETEKRIAELQINLVKNKLDPHFSINALNSVIQAIRDDRKEVAEDGLLQFVGMYRNMLLSADAVDRSLDEELSFTQSYLNLEKLRYEGVFDYRIEVAPGVDHATLIPKMIIQLHAENAVKHGLAPLKSGGLMHICVSQTEGGLQITITDNGIGYSRGVEASGSRSSQGLKMMQELYKLYPKAGGKKITSNIEELFDENGQVNGTRVCIIIMRAS